MKRLYCGMKNVRRAFDSRFWRSRVFVYYLSSRLDKGDFSDDKRPPRRRPPRHETPPARTSSPFGPRRATRTLGHRIVRHRIEYDHHNERGAAAAGPARRRRRPGSPRPDIEGRAAPWCGARGAGSLYYPEAEESWVRPAKSASVSHRSGASPQRLPKICPVASTSKIFHRANAVARGAKTRTGS